MVPAPVCVIVPVSEISVMLPGTVIVGIAIDATSRNPKLPVAPVKVNVGAGNTFPCVPKLMLPAELNELPVAAVKTPLSVISPVIAVPASVPPTVDVPKFNAAASMVAVPVPVVFSETAPLKVLAGVARLMFWLAAWVVKLPLPAVIAPLCVIPPVIAVPASVPPTVDRQKVKAAASVVAVPVPVVFSETAPLKVLAGVARLLFWLAAWVVKLPPPAVIVPLCVIPPVIAVPVSVPPTLDVPKFNAAASMVAVPVPAVFSETAPLKVLAGVARLMFWLAAWVVKLPLPAVIVPLCVIPPVVAVPASVPPTVDVPKFNAAASMVAVPVPVVFSETAPLKVLAGVARLMFWLAAWVVKLPLPAVIVPLCVIPPVIAVPASVPPTVDVPKFNAAASMVAVPVPVVFSETAPLKVLAGVARLMFWLAAWVVKLPLPAVIVPLCVIPPVVAVPASVPPTVDVPKFNAAASMVAVPVPVVFSETAPLKVLAGVARLMFWLAAWVVKLPLPAVILPLSAIPAVVSVPVSAPPPVDVPKFNAAASMVAVPVPVVFSETAPLKVLAGVARLMFWLAAWVVKLPLPAVIVPPCVIPPVIAVPVSVPPTLDVPKFNAAASMVAVPVPVVFSETAPLKVLAGVARLMFWLAAWVVKLPLPAVIVPLCVIPPVIAVPASVPPTVDVPKFNAAASMVAVPVPVVFSETAPLKVFPALPKLMV